MQSMTGLTGRTCWGGGIVPKHTERDARQYVSRSRLYVSILKAYLRAGGGTGRRAWFRTMYSVECAGSNPALPTSGSPIALCTTGSSQLWLLAHSSQTVSGVNTRGLGPDARKGVLVRVQSPALRTHMFRCIRILARVWRSDVQLF